MTRDNTIKIIHVHTDEKFANEPVQYIAKDFKNTVVLIDKNNSSKEKVKSKTKVFSNTPRELEELIKLCASQDLVVLYGLCKIKSCLALNIPSTTKIAWRFFGYELYIHQQELLLSHRTKDALNADNHVKRQRIQATMCFKRSMACLKNFLLNNPRKELGNAIKKCGLFIGISQTEYDQQKIHWPILPDFLQSPFLYIDSQGYRTEKSSTIIVGNSRSRYNNHLDVLNIIENNKNSRHIQFVLPFSYGIEDTYTEGVRKQVSYLDNVTLIDRFIPRDEYKEYFHNAAAAVFNCYRQMAMGNILMCLRNGVKIYLNTKNIIYEWLKAEGFKVFSIKTLDYDLSSNNIKLSPEEIEYNRDCYRKLTEKYNLPDFQKQIRDFVRETRR